MTDQTRVEADVVAEPDTDSKVQQDQQHEEHAPTKWQRLRDWWNWHYTWKKQQAQTIWHALGFVLGNAGRAFTKLVYLGFAYGAVSWRLWDWFARPVVQHKMAPNAMIFIMGVLTLALAYTALSFVGSIFIDWNPKEPKTTLVKPTPYFGNVGKQDVLDRIHENIAEAAYNLFRYGFPFIVLAIGWVLK